MSSGFSCEPGEEWSICRRVGKLRWTNGSSDSGYTSTSIVVSVVVSIVVSMVVSMVFPKKPILTTDLQGIETVVSLVTSSILGTVYDFGLNFTKYFTKG